MDLIYGTSNISKINHMKKMIRNSKINIIGFAELDLSSPRIDENGNSPSENARIKALEYYSLIKRPVFACDTGLYFENTLDNDQPGVNVRRVNNIELNDGEMIKYYVSLVDKNGGEIVAYYKNAICLVMDDKNIFEYDGDSISSDKFLICNEAHEIIKKGFPLDSLSKEIESKKYFYDLEEIDDNNFRTARGFNNFFEDILLI